MKYIIKTIGLLALLTLTFEVVIGATEKQQTNVVWKLAATANNNDSTSVATIVVDTNQILYMKAILSDCFNYLDADSLLKSDIDTLQLRLLRFQNKVEDGNFGHTQSWVRLLLFILAGIVLGLAIFVFFMQRDLNHDSKRIDKRRKEIEDLKEKIGKSNNNTPNKDTGSIEKEVVDLKKENRAINSRLEVLEHMLKERGFSSDRESSSTPNQQPSSKSVETQKLLYADSIIDGVFSHVKEQENEDTVFVLRLKSETDASITIYKGAYNKVLANASYLEGCDKQLIGNNSVEIVREGKAEKGFNGKWKVVSPLKVEIR